MSRTNRPTGSKALLAGAIAVLVIAAVLGAGLAWHAATLEVSDGIRGEVDVVAVDGWATPSGFMVVSHDERTRGRELVALTEDGGELASADIGPDRLAQVSMAGDVVFLDDGNRPEARFGATAISAVRLDGDRLEQVWSQELADKGSGEQLVELTVVAHAPSGETAIFGCARETGSCWFIGLDLAGEELWRIEADDRWPTHAAERTREQRPWLVPEELVVASGRELESDRQARPVLQVDLLTGEIEEMASGARAVVGRGFVVVSTVDDQGCGLVVLRDGMERWSVEVPCEDDGQAPRHSVVGSTVTFASGGEQVALEVDQERTGILPGDRYTIWTGVGTALAQHPTRQLRTIDDELIVDIGSGWSTGGVALDTVVVHRAHRSSNPLADEVRTEVKVIDAADGSVCAHARITGEPTRTLPAQPFLALGGCAALVEVGGTTYLLR